MRLPKYRRHSSNRGFVEHDRKRHYLPGAWNSPESIDGYKAFIRDVCGGTVSGGPVAAPPSTVAVVVGRFLDWAEVYYPDPRGTYQNLLTATKPLLAMYGNLAPAEFGPKKLKELQQILADSQLSRQYVNDIARRIKQCFKWAASEELIPVGIYQALATVPGVKQGRTPAAEPAKRQAVAWEHIEPVLPYVSSTIAAMLELQWHSGARSRSICLARPGQFKLEVIPWEWRPRHKREFAGRELVIYLGPKARAVLAPYLAVPQSPPDCYLFSPGTRTKRYGAFYSSQTYRQAVDRGIARANEARAKQGLAPIPAWTPHQIRHAKATLVRSAHGLEAAQAVIGHDSIDATQIYAARRTDDAKRIAESDG
jgi:integrase